MTEATSPFLIVFDYLFMWLCDSMNPRKMAKINFYVDSDEMDKDVKIRDQSGVAGGVSFGLVL